MRCILWFSLVLVIITFSSGCKFNRQPSDNLCQDSFPEISQYFSDNKGFKYSYLKQDSMYRQIYQDTIRYYDASTYVNLLDLQDAEYMNDKRDIFYKKNTDGTDELRLRRDIFSPIIIHDEGRYKYFETLLDADQGSRNYKECMVKSLIWDDSTHPYQRYIICFMLNDSVITYEQFYTFYEDENTYSLQRHLYLIRDDTLEFYNLGKKYITKFIPYQKYNPELYDSLKDVINRTPDQFDTDLTRDLIYPYPYIVTRDRKSGKEVLKNCDGDTIRTYYNPLKGCFTSMNLWCTNPDYYTKDSKFKQNSRVSYYLGLD